MQKSSLCIDHFVMNCKLCSDSPITEPEILPNAAMIGQTGSSIPATLTPLIPSQKPTVTNPEAKKVLTVSEEYSISCEAFSLISNQLNDAKELVKALENKLADAKSRRAELKKKLLETLALGDDNE